ncbi:beta-lactamase family protein [Acinetobacter colistiniresistens]|uniref:serine hydrolase domain-containing protein n=1 Tax=Acinetobacter colistiniresistens TaxID=280145 RepID=UPI00211CB14E|nr:serine hydrolase domain-containing protein [Acinetobacter colistiniresistens]UUM26580.1 beta-lactamase family protein [Acinetobacter colistiniresistens]
MKSMKLGMIFGALLISQGTLAQYDCKSLGMTECPSPMDTKLPSAHDMLTWSPSDRVVGFRNTYRLYDGSVFRPDPKNILPLQNSSIQITDKDISYTVHNKNYHLNDYLKSQNATGLIVLKDGKVVLEYYGQGNTPTTLWTSRSIGKSVVSTLVGIAIKQGKIHSVDDPIIKYLPDLKGTAWQNVTLKQILQHASGVEWNEDYADPNSDFAHMTYCEAQANPNDCVYKLVKNVKAKYKPGEVWSYNTGGAWLVGKVLEAATGQNIAHYLQENIWKKVGMEREGVWHSYQRNVTDMGGHGFNATLRDYARFALFVSKEGRLANGEKMLPDHWLNDLSHWTTAKNSVTPDYPKGQYGYQWWNYHPTSGAPLHSKNMDATFWGRGIFGQRMAINPKNNIIMMQWSTWDSARPSAEIENENALFFNAVSNYLTK